MVSRSRGGSAPFALTTIFYLLLVFVAPLALIGQVHAEDDAASREDLGTVIGIDLGTTYSYVLRLFSSRAPPLTLTDIALDVWV